MAGSKTGTPSIVKAARDITRLYQTYGASDLEAATNTQFKDCVVDLVACFVQLLLTDDYLLMRDRTGPAGPEDSV